MMVIHVNGSEQEFDDVRTLAELIDHLEIPGERRGIAVAVNDVVVPRIAWAKSKLVSGDRIEVIHAVQGG